MNEAAWAAIRVRRSTFATLGCIEWPGPAARTASGRDARCSLPISPAVVLRIRFFTPVVADAAGWQHAGGELLVGSARLCFLVDLDHWSPADYTQQWRRGIHRLANGLASTALMTAYRGPGARAHVMWVLWRDETHVYIQEQSVLAAELDEAFNPAAPYAEVGRYVPMAVNGLPIPEWHVPVEELGGLLPTLYET